MRDLDCWPSPADLAASSDVREEFYRRTGGPLPRAERGDVAATIFPPLASDGVRDCNAPTVYTRGRDSSCTGPVPTGDADGPYSLPPSPHAPVRPSVAVDHGNLGRCNTPKPVCDMGTFCWDEHSSQGRSVEAEASSGYAVTVAVAAAVLAGLVACLVSAWWWVL